jgi:AcrR family transcriptional regulator
VAKEDTKQRILEIANNIFSEKGYAGTTTREIAAVACVNELTIFRHFGNKEKLFQEVISQFSSVKNIKEIFDPLVTGDLAADLRIIAKTFLGMVQKDLTRIKLAHIESPANPILREAASQFPDQLRIYLSAYLIRLHHDGKIREDNYEMLAEIFFSAIFQHVLAKCDFPSGDKMRSATEDELVQAMVTLYTNSLLKKA